MKSRLHFLDSGYLGNVQIAISFLPNNVFSYSVGDWGLDYKLRVVRLDDYFEKEFDPLLGKLDTVGIMDFNSWNMLDGSAYRDYLYDVPLGVDKVGDGIANDWDYVETSGLTGAEKTVTERGQLLKFTGSPQQYAQMTLVKVVEGLTENKDFMVRIPYKCTALSGSAILQCNIKYLNSSDVQVGSTSYTTVTNAVEENVKVITETVPTGGSKVEIRLMAIAYTVGASSDAITVYLNNVTIANDGVAMTIPPLDVDSDGVSDGWDFATLGVADKNVLEGEQVVSITGYTLNSQYTVVRYSIACVALEDVAFAITGRVLGNVKFKAQIDWINVSTYLESSSSSSCYETIDTDIKVTGTAPKNTTIARLTCIIYPVASGDTGSAYFKNAIAVKNDFIENVGLLTEDDDLDGVANEWDFVLNSHDGTVITTVDDTNGQKIDITVGSSIVKQPFMKISNQLELVEGETLEYSVEARLSGDVSGQLNFIERPGNQSTATNFSNTEWETITLTRTAVAGTLNLDIQLRLTPLNVGSTGYVEYRNATLKQTNNSTYVSKVFDKSNNGNHAVQEVSAYQPRLINAGVFEVMSDGNYGMYFDGTDDFFDVTDNQGLNITTGDLSLMANFDPDVQGGEYIYTKNGSVFNNIQYGINIDANTRFILNGIEISADGDSSLSQKIIISTYNHINAISYLNGLLVDSNPYTLELIKQPNIQIGCRSASLDGTLKATFLTGHINRVTVFTKALTQTEITYLISKLSVPWTPADITTALWLDASDESTITENTSVAGNVAQWDDKSGNGNHAVQGTDANQCTTNVVNINNLNVLDFDGTDYFTFLSNLNVSVINFIFVSKTSDAQSIDFASSDTTNRYSVVSGDGDGTAMLSANFGSPTTWKNGTEIVLSTWGDVFNNYNDGNPKIVSFIGANTSTWGDFQIGFSKNVPFLLTGQYAEIIAITGTLSTSDRQKIEGYLAHKWGLQANLPSSHPYKTNKPY